MSHPRLSLKPNTTDALVLLGNAPDGFEGDSYSYGYAVLGGRPPYTVTLLTGVLPPDLTLAGTAIPAGGLATISGTLAPNP